MPLADIKNLVYSESGDQTPTLKDIAPDAEGEGEVVSELKRKISVA